MKKTSARTAKILRERGLDVGVSERWIPRANVRQDLFGIADLVAFGSDVVWLVQSCSSARLADHMRTIKKSPVARRWSGAAGRRIMVMAWQKSPAKKHGGTPKRPLWIYREIVLGCELEPMIDKGWRRP